jgi:hypothetical protein
MRGRAVFCVAFLAVGCGEDTMPGGSDMSVPADLAGPAVSGVVIENTDTDGGVVPIAGARVCILDHAEIPCATTDFGGNYTIALPPPTSGELDIAFNFTAPGHLGLTLLSREYHDGPQSITSWSQVPLWSDAQAADWASAAGLPYPPNGKSYIEFGVFHPDGSGGVVGATVTLTPPSGVGPIYFGTPANPSPTAVTSAGLVAFGGVTPGKFQLDVKGVSNCVSTTVGPEWPGPTATSVTGETAPDSLTERMVHFCD